MPYTQSIEQIKNYLQAGEAVYLALLVQMVNINSFSANPEGVNELGRVTAVTRLFGGGHGRIILAGMLDQLGVARRGRRPQPLVKTSPEQGVYELIDQTRQMLQTYIGQ